jgi:hypothetical protein
VAKNTTTASKPADTEAKKALKSLRSELKRLAKAATKK